MGAFLYTKNKFPCGDLSTTPAKYSASSRRFTMPDKIDKPSDSEFAHAIVQSVPQAGKPDILGGMAVAYGVGKVVKRVTKKR